MVHDNSEPIIQVALYEDNEALRCSFSTLLTTFPGLNLVGAYPTACHIIENCLYRMPDVIVMDIDLPGLSGVEAVAMVTSEFPAIKVLMLTVFDDNDRVFQSIYNGAVGYMLKRDEPALIMNAIREAYAGGAPMTPVIATKVLGMFRQQAPARDENSGLGKKQKEILYALTKGYSYKMIAEEQHISIDTVRFHIKKIYEVLHVHSMTEAVSKALKNKWY